MANILIAEPLPMAALIPSRGSGSANLQTSDPREVWIDSDVGTPATFDVDLGFERAVDTVFLGCLLSAHLGASWTISGGVDAYDQEVLMPRTPLRVLERDRRRRVMSHALWYGESRALRYIRISVKQPIMADPLSIGTLVVGDGFQPRYNKEWGSGRGVRDSSVVTRLPSGGVAVVEGARYGTYSWTLGDLDDDEADRLFEMQLGYGESRPVLVVEDPANTAGLRNRIHYGALTGLRAFERRNAVQTSWQLTMEDWAIESDPTEVPRPFPLLTLDGEPLALGGDALTLGE